MDKFDFYLRVHRIFHYETKQANEYRCHSERSRDRRNLICNTDLRFLIPEKGASK
jgi:hypothetical protein